MGAKRVQEVDISDEIFSYGGLRDFLMGTISLDILIIKGSAICLILSAVGENSGLDDSSLRLSQAEHQAPFKQKDFNLSLQTVECGIVSSQVYYFLLFKFLWM